ncbi:MAG: 4Fe-4S dicluster domain-containing protein [Planctomycetota bacterium]|nr:4Fe-4S dicluster domain-containing protein [Planctomycetota bacterium]
MQLGFVIDHSQCIGCHACTVACKSENNVPLGSFRTWVKYTEEGSYPEVQRSFAVLRCNQCTEAPCITICPVAALEKRPDGIVDVDPELCIGCKACMQGCPYDALYLNEDSGTAEKCHFCAHRTEQGLAPACAVVCPTEAIIPGDFDDPQSVVSTMMAKGDLVARKEEAGTGPNVRYREVTAAGVDPSLTSRAEGLLWANNHTGAQLDADAFLAAEEKAKARTTYDTPHLPPWGWKITNYLFAKSIAAGVFLCGMGFLPPLSFQSNSWASFGIPLLAMAFLAATLLLLVTDLKRPERFFSILLRPQWDSWLTRGSFILLAYGMLLTAWLGLSLVPWSAPSGITLFLSLATGVAAILSAAYTAWLFKQAKGRVLWMRRGLSLHLIAQAIIAGAAALFCLFAVLGESPPSGLKFLLLTGLAVHLGLTLLEPALGPKGRTEEYKRASSLVTHGPYARTHWLGGIFMGIALPAVLLISDMTVFAAFFSLLGLWIEEDLFIRAGQALPIS